jgi:hypothetical protein
MLTALYSKINSTRGGNLIKSVKEYLGGLIARVSSYLGSDDLARRATDDEYTAAGKLRYLAKLGQGLYYLES